MHTATYKAIEDCLGPDLPGIKAKDEELSNYPRAVTHAHRTPATKLWYDPTLRALWHYDGKGPCPEDKYTGLKPLLIDMFGEGGCLVSTDAWGGSKVDQQACHLRSSGCYGPCKHQRSAVKT